MTATLLSLMAATLLLLLLGALISLAVRSRRRKSSPARLSLTGRLAAVEKPLTPEGAVLVDGELWRARMAGGAGVGSGGAGKVLVTGARGHLLEVEPVD